MRLVNRIERDSIQAEYENWVSEENTRCKKLGSLLSGGGDGTSSLSKEASQLVSHLGESGGRVDDVRNWYKEYCAACRTEQAQLAGSFL